MPLVNLLRVFIACPSDVDAERQAVLTAIAEINGSVGQAQGVRLEPTTWRDVTPRMGPDPQESINASIDTDYEVFIGVLWTRFGSPTRDYQSGTLEEYTRALQRYLANPRSIWITVYFGEVSPIDLSAIDTEQLSAVRSFRRDIEEQRQGLYGTYRTLEEFQARIRSDLSRLILSYGVEWGGDGPSGQVPDIGEAATNLEHDDEEGYLDLIQAGNDHFTELAGLVQKIVAATSELGSKLGTRTGEVNAAQAGPPDLRFNRMKEATDQAADDLRTYAQEVESTLPRFTETMRSGLDSYGRAFTMLREYDDSGTNTAEAIVLLDTLVSNLDESLPQISNFRAIIEALPRATTRLSRAKQLAVQALVLLEAEWLNASSSARAIAAGLGDRI